MATIEKKGERVRAVSGRDRNAEIDNLIIFNIEYYKSEGRAAIDARIEELDREWDIERTLEINAAAFALTGTILGAFANKRWLILPALVTTFLAQHAVQGWCPPITLLRKLGIRTRPEIDREKYALKGLRGDFKNVDDSDQAWAAVN
ncbi:MAG: hypothetical protein WD824_08955 [Cyclobacteriaceae bacterium]